MTKNQIDFLKYFYPTYNFFLFLCLIPILKCPYLSIRYADSYIYFESDSIGLLGFSLVFTTMWMAMVPRTIWQLYSL